MSYLRTSEIKKELNHLSNKSSQHLHSFQVVYDLGFLLLDNMPVGQ